MGCFFLVVLHRQSHCAKASFKHNRSQYVLLTSKRQKITRIDWSATHTLYLNISRRTSIEKKSNRKGSAEYEGAKVNLGFDNKEESASRENQDQRKPHSTSYLSPDGEDEEKMEDYEVELCHLTKKITRAFSGRGKNFCSRLCSIFSIYSND